MFKNKKKIEVNDEELRIILYALNDFRSAVLKENKCADVISEVMSKLKNKMKLDKYELGVIINGLDRKRKIIIKENKDTSMIDNLLFKFLDIAEELKK